MNPSLYQINPRALVRSLGEGKTLDDIPDSLLDQIASRGFDWIWLLGVWQIGTRGREVSRTTEGWLAEYRQALPDCTNYDISGSPFAIQSYTVDRSLGGPEELRRLRERLSKRGLKLVLDFVPNHVALDHPWTTSRPDFFIRGADSDRTTAPNRWTHIDGLGVVAHGRDPNYPGWPDTLQLNYFNPALQDAMRGELEAVALQCDGVRCDMAMLLEPDVFWRTWGGSEASSSGAAAPFWEEAIAATRARHPGFMFMAEVYWDMEYLLQQKGFDYTYDKVLYDRLVHGDGRVAREHLLADLAYQLHMARFLENHDEPRIASVCPLERHRAAAVITFLSPGMRFIQHGQREGATVRLPVHLSRSPIEISNQETIALYDCLLPIVNSPLGKNGAWTLLECIPAWEENPTHLSFIAFLVELPHERILVAVNFAPHPGQCYVRIPDRAWGRTGNVQFSDLLSAEHYTRDTADLQSRGLYLDVSEWRSQIFRVFRPGEDARPL